MRDAFNSSVPSFIHHVEIQTQSARLLAAALAKALGMHLVSHARTSHGVSYALQGGQAMIVCTAPLHAAAGLVPIGDAEGFHDGASATPITTVRAIGLQVGRPEALAARAAGLVDRGAPEPVCSPAGIALTLRKWLGDIALRVLDGPVAPSDTMPSGVPLGMPGFAPLAPDTAQPDLPGGVIGIDHVAVTVPNVPVVSECLTTLLGWTRFRNFEEGLLNRPLTAVTLGSPSAEGLLTIVQPTTGDSVFRKALDANGGASVHHIALRCADVIGFVDQLARLGRWSCMPPPPDGYYEALRPQALAFLSEDEFALLRKHGLLLEAAGDCALVQVFLPYLGDVPGVFFELIGRIPRRGGGAPALPPPGCGGFGDGNVTRLYDCLVQAIDAPPR